MVFGDFDRDVYRFFEPKTFLGMRRAILLCFFGSLDV